MADIAVIILSHVMKQKIGIRNGVIGRNCIMLLNYSEEASILHYDIQLMVKLLRG